MGAGLALDDGLLEDLFQVLHVVVPEHAHLGPGRTRAVHDRGVIQTVTVCKHSEMQQEKHFFFLIIL